jgi:hypothetical protein
MKIPFREIIGYDSFEQPKYRRGTWLEISVEELLSSISDDELMLLEKRLAEVHRRLGV